MELNTIDRGALVVEAHNDTTGGSRGHHQFRGNCSVNNSEAVIASGLEFLGDSSKKRTVIVGDLRCFSMHQLFGVRNRGTKGFGNGLMPQAHTQKRNLLRDSFGDHRN